jgi:fructosamine-3-kinase
LKTKDGYFFIKQNASSAIEMFEKEKNGLLALAKPQVISVAQPIAVFASENHAYLLLEWIPQAKPKANFWEDFGAALAALHQIPQPYFGWNEDNFIGSLAQINSRKADFVDFFRECRLLPMLKLASEKHLIDERFKQLFSNLLERLPDLLAGNSPSFIHGDLWSGNFMIGPDGKVVLVDPAVYFGSRMSEIAFAKLFGGFAPQFFESYESCYPYSEALKNQQEILNLYPLMVHLNLFGRAYLPEIHQILAKFS